MKINIQIPIEWIPYAYANYECSPDEYSLPSEIHNEITASIVQSRSQIKTEELELYKEIIDDISSKSEMKSKFIELLKKEITEERYQSLKEQIFASDDMNSITKHRTWKKA